MRPDGHLTGWEYLIAKEREKQQKEWDAEGRPPLKEQHIVVPGHLIPVDSINRQSTVGKVAHAAVEYGWETRLGESEYVTAERWVKGEVVPGKREVFRFVHALSPDKQHYLSASSILLLCDGHVVDDKDEVLIHIAEYGIDPT